jgi:hypothetical protein
MSALPAVSEQDESGPFSEQQEKAIATAIATAAVAAAVGEQGDAPSVLPNPWPPEQGEVGKKVSGNEKDVQKSVNLSPITSLEIQPLLRKLPPQKQLLPLLQVLPPEPDAHRPEMADSKPTTKGDLAQQLTPLWNEVMENVSPVAAEDRTGRGFRTCASPHPHQLRSSHPNFRSLLVKQPGLSVRTQLPSHMLMTPPFQTSLSLGVG